MLIVVHVIHKPDIHMPTTAPSIATVQAVDPVSHNNGGSTEMAVVAGVTHGPAVVSGAGQYHRPITSIFRQFTAPSSSIRPHHHRQR